MYTDMKFFMSSGYCCKPNVSINSSGLRIRGYEMTPSICTKTATRAEELMADLTHEQSATLTSNPFPDLKGVQRSKDFLKHITVSSKNSQTPISLRQNKALDFLKA